MISPVDEMTSSERLFVRLEDDPLYAPETTVPGGTMREFTVPPALQAFVAHAMAYEETLPDDGCVTERVLPDGAMRLVFDLSPARLAPTVIGPSARPAVLQMRGRIHGLSVTLRPGASLALFGVPAHELAESAVSWQDVADPALRDHAARVHDAGDDPARARLLLDSLLGSLHRKYDDESLTARRAAALFRTPSGDRSVRAVAEALGVGERRLQQVFRAHVGLAPRTWSRIARMHDCLRLLRRPVALPWHALALDGGFYDQSHLINEFQALCGMTPEQFLRRGVSGSSKTAG
jgi:AraC-like DNA-binding protein